MSTNPHLQWDVVIYVNVTALILYGNIFCCLPWAVFVWLFSFSYLCLFFFFIKYCGFSSSGVNMLSRQHS